MVLKIKTEGFHNFFETIGKYTEKDVFVLFTGSVDSSGKSWCPDCTKADPVVEKGSSAAPDDSILIICEVGERNYWKDKQNEFRTHDKLRLTGVPTLLKWGSSKRLVEDDCAKEDLVTMMFEED